MVLGGDVWATLADGVQETSGMGGADALGYLGGRHSEGGGDARPRHRHAALAVHVVSQEQQQHAHAVTDTFTADAVDKGAPVTDPAAGGGYPHEVSPLRGVERVEGVLEGSSDDGKHVGVSDCHPARYGAQTAPYGVTAGL